jgi:hypothetical protein
MRRRAVDLAYLDARLLPGGSRVRGFSESTEPPDQLGNPSEQHEKQSAYLGRTRGHNLRTNLVRDGRVDSRLRGRISKT